MAALEPHRVVSDNAEQPSWPLGGPPWLRAAEGVLDATVVDPDEDIAVHATKSVVELSARQTLDIANARLTLSGAAGAAPIQYP